MKPKDGRQLLGLVAILPFRNSSPPIATADQIKTVHRLHTASLHNGGLGSSEPVAPMRFMTRQPNRSSQRGSLMAAPHGRLFLHAATCSIEDLW